MTPSTGALAHPQLQAIAQDLLTASDHVARFAAVTPEIFARRPAATSWSAGECVEHLSHTTRAFLPILSEGLAQVSARTVTVTHRYRAGFVGAALAWTLRPPYRLRTKTSAAFEPVVTGSRDEVLSAFAAAQALLLEQLRRADGRDLERIRIVSPFSTSVRYNLFAAFTILVAHEQRHLWQADRALEGAGQAPGGR